MQSSATPTEIQPDSAHAGLHAGTRRLILTRHAKAVEEDVGGDHTRALSERGLADAAALKSWLAEQSLTPNLALCSTATRTRQTLAAIAPSNTPTILSDKLYLASVGDMLALLQSTDDAVQTLLMVCHNPGAHGLLALLAGQCAHPEDADKLLLKFPTSACAVITFPTPHWREVAPEMGTLEWLRY